MEQSNQSFVFYESYAKGVRKLAPAEQLAVYNALIDYMFYGIEPQLEGAAEGMFLLIEPTVTAARNRHKEKQRAAQSRWSRQKSDEAAPPQPPAREEPREQTKQADNHKPVAPPKQEESRPSAPNGRPYHIGTLHNVYLNQQEHDALQKQLGDDMNAIINRYSKYKQANGFVLLRDFEALQYFLNHGTIPEGKFERNCGET